MKTVFLRGPFLTHSGYGTHGRQIAKWLLTKQNIDVRFGFLPWGNTPWCLDEKAFGGLAGEMFKRSIPLEKKADVAIQLQLPNEWSLTEAEVNVGVSAVVETDRCNPLWVAACNKMNKVIVPSKHVQQTLNNSGCLFTNVSVIGESYNESIDDEDAVKSALQTLPTFSTNFNFLIFGQITGNNEVTDRKNLFNTVKWLCETFKDDKDVGVVLKVNAGRDSKIDKENVRAIVQNMVRTYRRGKHPTVHVIHGRLSDAQNAALFVHPQIKALVSATRGEGFGLPIVDAAASGLPIIATNWSGHLDFLNLGKFLPIAYTLREIPAMRVDNVKDQPARNIFMQGTRWAEPNEGDFKKVVKKFRSESVIPNEWAKELSLRVKEKYSFNAISKLYDNVLGELIL